MPGFTRGSYKAKAIMKRRGVLWVREEVCSCRLVRERGEYKEMRLIEERGRLGENKTHHLEVRINEVMYNNIL